MTLQTSPKFCFPHFSSCWWILQSFSCLGQSFPSKSGLFPLDLKLYLGFHSPGEIECPFRGVDWINRCLVSIAKNKYFKFRYYLINFSFFTLFFRLICINCSWVTVALISAPRILVNRSSFWLDFMNLLILSTTTLSGSLSIVSWCSSTILSTLELFRECPKISKWGY